ncbi:hypothetical protein [Flavobacterium sp.]|uniref:hypothetical protein n=1 Tax=Flavobacterium sp. TaxID=239 RepID=UPI00286DFA85|nr:hypothetical protein [Flavobacterium sp.]
MNKFKKITLLTISLAGMFASCEKIDDNTGGSAARFVPGVVGAVNWSFPTVQSVNEVDKGVYTFTVTIDKPQSVPVGINIEQIAGNATKDDDFEFATLITIPAFATSVTSSVKILDDCTVEGVEDFTLRISDLKTSNASIPSKEIKFTINNNLSPLATTLDLEFDYNKSFILLGNSYTLCGVAYDMDFYILDAAFADTGIYDAAASGCPEKVSLSTDPTSATYLADGVYYVFYDTFEKGNMNGGANTTTDDVNDFYHEPFDIPVTVHYERCGGIDPGTYVQAAAFVHRSVTPGTLQFDLALPNPTYVVTIEVNAGVFTLKNNTSEVLASGRVSQSKLAQAMTNARRNNPNKK